LTVIHQIVEDKLGQPVSVMLASFREMDDFVCDDFSNRVINITLEQERVADLMKCGTHRLDVRRVDVVFAKGHRCSLSSRHGQLDGRAIERFVLPVGR
jgi:hypothetical protein